MDNKIVLGVAQSLINTGIPRKLFYTAKERATEAAFAYESATFNTLPLPTVEYAFRVLKERHAHYVTVRKAIDSLARVSVDMGLGDWVLTDAPPPEAE